MQNNYEILIIQKTSEDINLTQQILKNVNYNFTSALKGTEAIELLKSKRFDLLLLDINISDVNGLAICQLVKNTSAISDTPVVFFTDVTNEKIVEEAFKYGAVDYIKKPFHPIELRYRIANHLESYINKKELRKNNLLLNHEIHIEKNQHKTDIEIAQHELVAVLMEIIKLYDDENVYHVSRVADLAKQLAMLEGNLTAKEIESVYIAAPLYNIGKILIDSDILKKSSKLSEEELKIVQKYPTHANEIFKNSTSELMQVVKTIAYQHHEHFDGTGYPQGLKGEEIHIFGRIVAIADVLDSVTHDRAYDKAWSFEKAAKYIMSLGGSKFDQRLVNIFAEHLEVFKEIIEETSLKENI